MTFVKCKNDAEKLATIRKYCQDYIDEYNHRIKWFIAQRNSILDYADEIHDLKTRLAHFEVIAEIADADEFTSIMLH